MNLTKDNYYSHEADVAYMSVSQFEAFEDCELQAYRKYVLGKREEPSSDALLIGNYMHTKFESAEAHESFCNKYRPQIYKGKNLESKRQAFINADCHYNAAKGNKLFVKSMEGTSEEIYTFCLFGCDWKIRVDNINHDKLYFTDLKYVKSIREKEWMTVFRDDYGMPLTKMRVLEYRRADNDDMVLERNEKVMFWEKWDYWLRFALYKFGLEIKLGKIYRPFMAVLSKETPPDMEIFEFEDEDRIAFEIRRIEEYIDRVMAIKRGEVEPEGCGVCELCRAQRIENPKHRILKASSIYS